MAVTVNINHETGDLTEYTSTVTDSGDLSVAAGAALAGTNYGLSCLIDDTTAIYGQFDVTSSTGVVRLRFYLDPNGITIGNNDEFTVINLRNGTGVIGFVELGYTSGGGYRIVGAVINDSNAPTYTSPGNISDAPHYVELKIIRSSSDGVLDGTAQLWVDGSNIGTSSGVDNYTRFAQVTSFRLGAVSGIDAATSGTFYLDELVVNDDGSEIGPVSAVGGIVRPVFFNGFESPIFSSRVVGL